MLQTQQWNWACFVWNHHCWTGCPFPLVFPSSHEALDKRSNLCVDRFTKIYHKTAMFKAKAWHSNRLERRKQELLQWSASVRLSLERIFFVPDSQHQQHSCACPSFSPDFHSFISWMCTLHYNFSFSTFTVNFTPFFSLVKARIKNKCLPARRHRYEHVFLTMTASLCILASGWNLLFLQ